MQQVGEGGSQSQYGDMAPAVTATATTQQPVESASPISSRPPASVTGNLDELIRLSGGGDEDTLGGGGDEGDRAGGIASGNRWPRQETLALLKIRSDMDAAFRDATIKGPLWEDVSRKLAELGYGRSAKKCKEKFENVHKYYKRTKEGRAGRQDGKSYKFFSQLEALHSSTSTSSATTSNVSASLQMPETTVTTTNANTNTITLDVAPVSIGIPMSISSSVRIPPPPVTSIPMSSSIFPPLDLSATISVSAAANANVCIPGSANTQAAPTTIPISFSSNSSSSSPETEDDDDDDDDDIDFAVHPSNTTTGSSRKRKRKSSSSSSTNRMMDFFEGLMKQVMQKQEMMQQRFLEVIEKREQDRMIREEAWKRQEMARLAREHELMAKEKAISASRDAAIIAFLQKITGQSIQLPPTAPSPAPASVVAAPAVPVPVPAPTVLVSHIPQSSFLPQERRDQPHVHQSQNADAVKQQQLHHQPAASTSFPSDLVMAIPEQQLPPQEVDSSGNLEAASSRWPKVEVHALIKLRSGLEPRYQEAGPKGPLWEEISAGMQRMGYKRSAKRCKEKWENINKYFKKVKESNKKRPEDAKTCPYFHELDALYQKKIIGGATSTSSFSSHCQRQQEEHQQENIKLDSIPAANPPESSNIPAAIMPAPQLNQASESENKNVARVDTQASGISFSDSIFGEGNGSGASKKPEDIVKELMNQQGMQQKQQQQRQPSSVVDDFDKNEEHNMDSDSDNMDQDEDIDDNDEDGDDELEEERKMAYKVEFQRQNANASSGGGNAPSFLAMVQ